MLLDQRYRLDSLLGEGGMGTVWRGFDQRIGRTVAVKVLALDGAPDSALQRFFAEANAAGALNHPHVITIHDVGQAELDGRPIAYLVMELLEGRSLAGLLSEGPPRTDQVLSWAAQICDALAAAHRAGIVHRDIKPANVVLTGDGTIKLLDFGIARHLRARRPALTTVGSVIGTPAYMAPEQALGEQDLGPAVDLYAVGCVLYELLTGQAPFNGDTLAVLHQHVADDPVAPGAIRPGIPAELDALVLQLLAKSPEHRPPSAEAVAGALRALSRTTRTITVPLQPTPAPAGAGSPATPSAKLRRVPTVPSTRLQPPPTKQGPAAAMLSAAAASAGVFAQTSLLSALPTPWPAVVSGVLAVVLAVAFTVFSGPAATSDDAGEPGDTPVGLMLILPMGLLACGLLLWLSPLAWWAVLILSWVICPALMMVHTGLSRTVAKLTGRSGRVSDLASTAGLVNGFTLVLLLALTTGWAWPANTAAGALLWGASAIALGRALPRG